MRFSVIEKTSDVVVTVQVFKAKAKCGSDFVESCWVNTQKSAMIAAISALNIYIYVKSHSVVAFSLISDETLWKFIVSIQLLDAQVPCCPVLGLFSMIF